MLLSCRGYKKVITVMRSLSFGTLVLSPPSLDGPQVHTQPSPHSHRDQITVDIWHTENVGLTLKLQGNKLHSRDVLGIQCCSLDAFFGVQGGFRNDPDAYGFIQAYYEPISSHVDSFQIRSSSIILPTESRSPGLGLVVHLILA